MDARRLRSQQRDCEWWWNWRSLTARDRKCATVHSRRFISVFSAVPPRTVLWVIRVSPRRDTAHVCRSGRIGRGCNGQEPGGGVVLGGVRALLVVVGCAALVVIGGQCISRAGAGARIGVLVGAELRDRRRRALLLAVARVRGAERELIRALVLFRVASVAAASAFLLAPAPWPRAAATRPIQKALWHDFWQLLCL